MPFCKCELQGIAAKCRAIDAEKHPTSSCSVIMFLLFFQVCVDIIDIYRHRITFFSQPSPMQQHNIIIAKTLYYKKGFRGYIEIFIDILSLATHLVVGWALLNQLLPRKSLRSTGDYVRKSHLVRTFLLDTLMLIMPNTFRTYNNILLVRGARAVSEPGRSQNLSSSVYTQARSPHSAFPTILRRA